MGKFLKCENAFLRWNVGGDRVANLLPSQKRLARRAPAWVKQFWSQGKEEKREKSVLQQRRLETNARSRRKSRKTNDERRSRKHDE